MLQSSATTAVNDTSLLYVIKQMNYSEFIGRTVFPFIGNVEIFHI